MAIVLNQRQIAEWKSKQLEGGQKVCPLCRRNLKEFKTENIVVDHDHEADNIRGLLCRVCNAQEGHVNTVLVNLSRKGDLQTRLNLYTQLIKVIAYNTKVKPPAKTILGYAYKAVGKSVPVGQRKKEAIQWLIRLGKYWNYHKVDRTGLHYGRST